MSSKKERSGAKAEDVIRLAPTKQKKVVPKDDASDAESDEAFDPRGVIYIGHIPHGFYEKQVRGFLSQFGDIKHVYLSRSRKSGKSRGYGFVQFTDPLVARIASETLNGMPLEQKVLKSHVVDADKVDPSVWKFADRTWSKIPWRRVIRDLQLMPKPATAIKRRMNDLLKRESIAQAKLQALGIDYSFDSSYKQLSIDRGLLMEDDASDVSEEEVEDLKPVSKGKGNTAVGGSNKTTSKPTSTSTGGTTKATSATATKSAESAVVAGAKRKRSVDVEDEDDIPAPPAKAIATATGKAPATKAATKATPAAAPAETKKAVTSTSAATSKLTKPTAASAAKAVTSAAAKPAVTKKGASSRPLLRGTK